MSYLFKVGQFAYINYTKKRLIIPVKIIEQIIRKTEDNEIVDWNLMAPDSTQLLYSELSDPIFASLDEAKTDLLRIANEAIEKMCITCSEIQNKTWPKVDAELKSTTRVKNNKNLDKIKVTLSDGSIANVSMPNLQNVNIEEQ
jgi:hypothetical protein